MSRLAVIVVLCISTQIFASTPALETIAESNAKFSRDFFKALNNVHGNLISSPLSAHLALSMTQLGAGGSTASQMSRALYLPADVTLAKTGFKQLGDQLRSENSEETNIKIANRLYMQTGIDIKQQFINSVKDTFNSEPQSVDFDNPGTRNNINRWVEERTNNKIKNLLKDESVDADTLLLLVNTIYFNGKWVYKFGADSILKRPFFTSETESISVPMMSLVAKNYKYKVIENLDAKFIQLAYEGYKMSLVILLPNSRTGLAELENKMQTEDLSSLINLPAKKNNYFKLTMPKFKIETEFDLKNPLTKMGLGDIFGNDANFEKITTRPVKISKVLQKTVINVAENGTEAAAVTYVQPSSRSTPFPLFVVDHPFLFYLVHRTTDNNHVVFFSGRVVKPLGY